MTVDDNAINPDPVVVDTAREMVRYGEVPTLSGPGLGIPAQDPQSMGASLSGTSTSGPGLGIPAVEGTILFHSNEEAKEAYDLMEELAEEQQMEPEN